MKADVLELAHQAVHTVPVKLQRPAAIVHQDYTV